MNMNMSFPVDVMWLERLSEELGHPRIVISSRMTARQMSSFQEVRRVKKKLQAIQAILHVPDVTSGPCCNCLEEMKEGPGRKEGASPVVQLSCSHAFHKTCITRWLLAPSSCQCPLCKQQLVATGSERLV